jgi:hypothetical protein
MLLINSPWTDANAISVDVASGRIHMDTTTPAPFDDIFISLRGSDFSLDNNFLQDSFLFTGSPNPRFSFLNPTTPVTFTGVASLREPDLLVFNGVSYQASGNIAVTTPPVVVSSFSTQFSFLTESFTLGGTIHGRSASGSRTVDLSLSGAGIMTAQLRQGSDNSIFLDSITYEVIPEPTTLLLFASGLTALTLLKPHAAASTFLLLVTGLVGLRNRLIHLDAGAGWS